MVTAKDIKVLCIIPCFNAQDTIARAIESVINQSHQNWELVIVDDASTDKSVKIAKKYLKDPRVTLLQNKTNRGCYYSRNRGLYYAKDKEWNVFTIHDADDSSTSDRFHIYTSILVQNPDASVIGGVYQGKRWKQDKNSKFIKFLKKSSIGINWYGKMVFNTFGYFDNTRFSGDKEYYDRIMYYLQVCFPEKSQRHQEMKKVFLQPSLDIAYVYTTHTTSTPTLSVSNSQEVKDAYIKQYQEKFNSWTHLDHFYQNFTPHEEDL